MAAQPPTHTSVIGLGREVWHAVSWANVIAMKKMSRRSKYGGASGIGYGYGWVVEFVFLMDYQDKICPPIVGQFTLQNS